METDARSAASERREDQYQKLILLLLNQGRTKEAAELMERHEARREWELNYAEQRQFLRRLDAGEGQVTA